jgi:hypothetical protein
MNWGVRRYRIITAWALTCDASKTRPIQVLLWWLPWTTICGMALWYMPFLPAVVLCSITAFAGVNVWLLGFLHARRKNIYNLAVLTAEWSDQHPDLLEFELKEGLKTRAAQK